MIGCLSFLYILINIAKCAIYVDATAICPCYGTPTQPFNNIQEGIDVAVQNRFDTVIVRDGYYVATSKLNIPTSDNLQYIISENGSQNTIIDCPSRPIGSGFDINTQMNGQLITLQGFTMKNCYYGARIGSESNIIDMNITNAYDGIYISLPSNSNMNITIMDSLIQNPTNRGIYISCSSSTALATTILSNVELNQANMYMSCAASRPHSVLMHNTRILNYRDSYSGIYLYYVDRIEIYDSVFSSITPLSSSLPISMISDYVYIRDTVIENIGYDFYYSSMGIDISSNNVNIYNSNILNNAGYMSIQATGTTDIRNSKVRNNADYGIQISVEGNLNMINNEICNNTGYGVYISASNGDVGINGTVLSYNGDSGILISGGKNVEMVNNEVYGNLGYGVEILGTNMSSNIDSSKIFSNNGYGIYISGTGSVSSVNLNRIYSNNGNGIIFDGNEITLDSNYIYNNNGTNNEGGGINVKSGSISITNNSITNNVANHGGGIYWYGTSTKTCLIKDNYIGYNNALSEGGGIHLNTSMATNAEISCEISNTRISGNTCNYLAGGLYVVRGDVLLTENTMIYDNHANAYGSDLFCYQANFTVSYDSKIQNDTDNDIYCNIYCNFNYLNNGQNVYCRSGFMFV